VSIEFTVFDYIKKNSKSQYILLIFAKESAIIIVNYIYGSKLL